MRRIIAALLLSLSPGVGHAAPDPPGFKNWDTSPEAYFLTREERREWGRLRTDEEAREFVARYWTRRDPTPATAANEFRETVLRRIGAAGEQFEMRRQKGASSTRGRLLVVLGPPSQFSQERPEQRTDPASGVTRANELARLPGRERILVQRWLYKKEKFDPSLGMTDIEIRIQVDQDSGMDEPLNSALVTDLLQRVAEKTIVNPGLLAAGDFSSLSVTGASALPLASGPSAAALAALDAVLSEKRVQPGAFWAGTFRTASGERVYTLRFELPPEGAPATVRLAGNIRGEGGEEIVSVWEEGPLTGPSGPRGMRVFQRSVVLPSGRYRASFGLFAPDGGTVLAAARESLAIEPVGSGFEVSPLLLSSEVVRLAQSPPAPQPFLFGAEKPFRVEPRGDRLFSKQESLWYFFTVANPAPATPAAAPRIMVRTAVTRDGKPAFDPLTAPAELMPLSAGQYANGSEIPLANVPPGEYAISVTVRDLNAARDSAAWKGIERSDRFVVLNPDGTMPDRKSALR